MQSIKSKVYPILAPLFKNQVYTMKSGLASGLKRRGGFGFLHRDQTLTLEHQFLQDLDSKGKTVYDIGGHIGLITMFFARKVGETGNIVTFEPNPRNYAAIVDHIKLNNFTNVKVIPMGVGHQKETLEFIVTGSARGTASVTKQQEYDRQDAQVELIEVDSLDNQIADNNLPKPDFVKIDVEGLELSVLKGMSQTISDHKPELFVELHGVEDKVVAEFILNSGYNIYQVEDQMDLTKENIDRVRGHLYATPL